MQEQIVAPDLSDYPSCMLGVIEEIAVHALGGIRSSALHDAERAVDGFDDCMRAVRTQEFGSVSEILQVHALGFRVVRPRRNHARHNVHQFAIQCPSIFGRARKTVTEFLLAPRHCRQSPVTSVPVAHRCIEQHHLQSVGLKPSLEFTAGVLVRHLKLHRLETYLRGGFKAIEKWHFSKEVMEVGGKLGHRGIGSRVNSGDRIRVGRYRCSAMHTNVALGFCCAAVHAREVNFLPTIRSRRGLPVLMCFLVPSNLGQQLTPASWGER